MQNLRYFDCEISLPYPIGDKNGKMYLPLKTPANDVFTFFLYLELLGFQLKLIKNLTEYEVTKVEGKTRLTYRKLRIYTDTELGTQKAVYQRVKKRQLKDRI